MSRIVSFGSRPPGYPGRMGYQVTDVQKVLSGFDYPGSPQDLADHAKANGAADDLVGSLSSLKKDSFDGPSAVMHALGEAGVLGGSNS